MASKTLRPLKKGDKCFVRLHTREVVEAIYLSLAEMVVAGKIENGHWLYLDNPLARPRLVSTVKDCRFVCTNPELHARALAAKRGDNAGNVI
jgi:hypothetical protein